MDVLRDEASVFDATLNLERHELTPATRRRCLLRFPPMTLKVVAGDPLAGVATVAEGKPRARPPQAFERDTPMSESRLPSKLELAVEPAGTPSATFDGSAAAGERADAWFRRRMLALLGSLRGCDITLVESDGTLRLGTPEPGRETLCATVVVHDPSLYRVVALSGTVGVGEAYMDGLWSSAELTTLVRIFVRNRDLLDRMETGFARLGGVLLRLWAKLRRNSRGGSRRNIARHYDLGNELFQTFLDDNLMYSAAVFRDANEPLEAASRRKLDRICRKLELRPGLRLIEIGTGWGGFALHAAREYGCHVTTTTISRAQHELARERVRAAGLEDRVTLLLQDFRDLGGRYDRLVSIEMIEAIGADNLDTYFAKCSDLLEPDGMALIQAITIEDRRYAQALAQRRLHPAPHLPGQLHPGDLGHDRVARTRQRHEALPARGHRPELRDHAPALARALPSRASTRCVRSATPSASCACGSITCATARAASSSARSATCRCCCSSPGAGAGNTCRTWSRTVTSEQEPDS
jgi:cyclopropane-fatty-acyl-phospholipid synthase